MTEPDSCCYGIGGAYVFCWHKKTPTQGLAFFLPRKSFTAACDDRSLDADRNRPVRRGACRTVHRQPAWGLDASACPGACSFSLDARQPVHHDLLAHGQYGPLACVPDARLHHAPDVLDAHLRCVAGVLDAVPMAHPRPDAQCVQHGRHGPQGARTYAANAQACLCSWHSSLAWQPA